MLTLNYLIKLNKNLKSILIIILLIICNLSQGQNNKNKKFMVSSFQVLGNCDMCKNKIESSAIKLKGVRKATWKNNQQLLTVKFNPKKIQLNQIKQEIANVGYDTDEIKTTNEIYNMLHYCCKYDRGL